MLLPKIILYFLCALALMCQLPVVKADPITLNATSVFANYDHVDTYEVSGPGFSFSGYDHGYNLPYGVVPGPDEFLGGYGFVTSYGYNAGQYDAQLHGFIDVAGAEVSAIFFGMASTPLGSTPLATNPSVLPQTISLPLTISGSFTACLQPGNEGFRAGCDPDFLNYAVVNVNLPGSYNILLVQYGDPSYPEPNVVVDRLTYTAAAIPEPSSVALVVAGSLLVLCIGKIRSRKVWHSLL